MKKYLLYLIPIFLLTIVFGYLNILPKSNFTYGIIAAAVTVILVFLEETKQPGLNRFLILLAFLLILAPRIIPYLNNSIPIGYDAGIYKYAIEHPFEEWMQVAVPRGFTFPLAFLNLFLPINFILTYLLIGFELLLGFALYKTVKEYVNKNTAIIALLLFSVSFAQFRVFTFMYYKNILALSLLLFAFYFLKKQKRIPFILITSWLGSMHQPTFLLFGLSYAAYTFISYKKDLKKNVINGILILALTLLSYAGVLKETLFPQIKSAVGLEIGAGTFIGILQYQSLFLILLPFLFLGVYHSFRNREINILFLWFIFNLIIVSFQLIFFNRYIIHLDLILIILASIGLYLLFQKDKWVGTVSLAIILLFSAYIVFSEAMVTEPLISKERLQMMESLQNVNGSVMSTHKNDSPWLLGYSGKKAIAPGLWEFNKWSLEEWNIFWYSGNFTQVKPLLDRYEKPIYIVTRNFINQKVFQNPCFQQLGKIYRYDC